MPKVSTTARAVAVGLALCLAAGATANELDVPIIVQGGDGQMATCTSSTVRGLDPNGDGFLSIRTGPGTQYAKIGELHNGDIVYVFEMRGEWAGVVYGASTGGSCAATETHELTHPEKGWVHSNWLQHLAG